MRVVPFDFLEWSMKNDLKVKRSSAHVFADIGLPHHKKLPIKAPIVAAIGNSIRAQMLTQVAAGERMGARQPDVCRLLNGGFEKFSLERLLGYLLALGNDVTIDVRPTNDDCAPCRIKLAL
jgi:predicted XRE-type DNA-binding protein